MSERRVGPGLVQIERSDRGWEVTLEGYTEASAVGGYLWPNGVPSQVTIAPLTVVEEPAQVGTFELRGVTSDAIQAMEPWIANWFEQEAVVTTDSPGSQDPSDPSNSTPPASDPPGVAATMDENQLTDWVHFQLESAHWIGGPAEIVGVFASEGSTLAAVAELLGPVGEIAGTIIILWEVVRAFGAGTRLQEQEGFCYGLMWEAFGMPDGAKIFVEWAGDSADDLRNAFYDGVGEGREKAKDVQVHNAIMMKVAYYMASVPCDQGSAQQTLINELWKKLRETGFTRDWLDWPKPADMAPIS